MNKPTLATAIVLGMLATFSVAASAENVNPYAGQASREIKALAADEVQNYLAGKGMGLAKAAELNGYPGPSHVLSLSSELGLSPEQKQQTETLFKAMEMKAQEAGRHLVDEERKLDHLFASRTITPENLALSLRRIGEWQAQVRQIHLESHLTQMAVLTPDHVAAYMKLRGYSDAANTPHHSTH